MKSYGTLCTAYYDLDKPFTPSDALAFYKTDRHEASFLAHVGAARRLARTLGVMAE